MGTKAASDSPCAGLGYTKYSSTVTHGVWPVKMTLDLYDLPSDSESDVDVGSLTDIQLARFYAKDSALTHSWRETNDPVMGGASNGTFTVKDGVAIMDGSVNLIPRLQAPGFIKFETYDMKPFPDASNCKSLRFIARSLTNYSGYRISIGNKHAPGGKFFAFGFKAPFEAPQGEFGEVTIAFKQYSDFWDDSTGKILHTCAEDTRYCPDAKTLSNMSPITFWAEGVEGSVHLEVKSIAATSCDTAGLPVSATSLDMCSLYTIKDRNCGQSDLDCKYAPYAKKFMSSLKD